MRNRNRNCNFSCKKIELFTAEIKWAIFNSFFPISVWRFNGIYLLKTLIATKRYETRKMNGKPKKTVFFFVEAVNEYDMPQNNWIHSMVPLFHIYLHGSHYSMTIVDSSIFYLRPGTHFRLYFLSLSDLLAVDTWNMFNIWLKYSCRWANETGKKINFIVAMKFNLTLIFQWWSRNPKCILIGLVCLRHISSGFIFITLLKLFILNRWFIFYINNKANLFSVSDFNYKFWLD